MQKGPEKRPWAFLNPTRAVESEWNVSRKLDLVAGPVAVVRNILALVDAAALKLDDTHHQQLALRNDLATIGAGVSAAPGTVRLSRRDVRTHLACSCH